MTAYLKRHFWGILAVLIATAALWFSVAEFAGNPVEEVKTALSPEAGEVALKLCLKPETTVTLVKTPSGSFYEGKYEEPGLRYDLTWQAAGTSVAVERTRGRDFDLWAEQIDLAFWNCVDTKTITTKEAVH